MPSWIRVFYVGAKTPLGFLPVSCPNCKEIMEVKDAVYKLGYWRHKKCWKEVMENK